MDETVLTEVRELARRVGVIEDVLTTMLEERERADELRSRESASSSASSATMGPQSTSAGLAVPAWSPSRASVATDAAARLQRERALRERVSSVNWLGAISVICFVLAAAFIIKLAIDTGWLTPARQIGMAAVLGVALIGVGLRLMKFDRAYASLLPGAGVIVLYLTVVAARSYHHLIGFEVSIASVALVSAITIWLYTVIKHEVYPITAALGAYLAPFLLGADAAQVEFILYYHIACSISFATISIWLESRTLSVLAAYLAIGVSFAISSLSPFEPVYIWILLAHFTIFAVATVVHSIQTRVPMSARDAWAYFPVLLLFYAGEYALISKLNPAIAPYVSLGFAGVLIALYFAGRAGLQRDSLESVSVVSAYASIVLFHSFYLEILDDTWKPWLLPVLVFAAAFRSLAGRANEISKAEAVPMLAVGAVVVIEYFRLIFSLVDGHADPNLTVVSFVAPISLAVLFMRERKTRASTDLMPILFMAHVLAILAFYNIAKPAGSLAVSGVWLAYAVVVMGAGFMIRDKVVAKSALATLGLAAAKALLYDASMAPAPVRIGCLLVTGLVLYGCGFLLKRIETWSETA